MISVGPLVMKPMYKSLVSVMSNTAPYVKNLSKLSFEAMVKTLNILSNESRLLESEENCRTITNLFEAINYMLSYNDGYNQLLWLTLIKNRDLFIRIYQFVPEVEVHEGGEEDEDDENGKKEIDDILDSMGNESDPIEIEDDMGEGEPKPSDKGEPKSEKEDVAKPTNEFEPKLKEVPKVVPIDMPKVDATDMPKPEPTEKPEPVEIIEIKPTDISKHEPMEMPEPKQTEKPEPKPTEKPEPEPTDISEIEQTEIPKTDPKEESESKLTSEPVLKESKPYPDET
jgi:hypothetical protein